MSKKLLAMLLCAVMLLGMVSASAEEHEHVYVDGKPRCEICNECRHPEEYVDVWVDCWEKVYTPIDNVNHKVSGDAVECFWCNACDYYTDKPLGFVTITEKEAHNYMGGNVCGMCEHENTCEHTETKVVVDRGSGGVYRPVDSEKHRYSGHKEIQERCAHCNQLLGWIDEGGYVSEEEPHEVDENGVCTLCEACTHINTTSYTNSYDETYEPVDNKVHNVISDVYETIVCNQCGAMLKEDEYVGKDTKEAAHRYSEGVCLDCEHENTCEHENIEIVVVRKGGYQQIDSEKHLYYGDQTTRERCTACSALLGWIDEGGYVEEEEAHEFDADGKCPCGYETEVDPNRTEMNETGWITGGTVNVRAGAGTDYDRIGSVYFANELHIVASVTNDKGEVWYEFDYEGTKGYVRSDLITFAGEPTRRPTAAPTPKPTAKPTAAPTAVPTAEPTAAPTAEPTAVPVVEPTAEPAAEVPAQSIVDEVLVEQLVNEEKPMIEAVIAVLDQIIPETEDETEVITVQIVNIEKVVTEEEKAVLDTLSVKEQMLVLLSSIGHKEAVEAVLNDEESELTISEEAQNMMTAIEQRIAAMTEEEKTAFETMLLESFPVVEIELEDGTKCQYFAIELLREQDGEQIIERFGFRYDDETEGWIFMKLEAVAAPVEDIAA